LRKERGEVRVEEDGREYERGCREDAYFAKISHTN
jgi:hypothetical protein